MMGLLHNTSAPRRYADRTEELGLTRKHSKHPKPSMFAEAIAARMDDLDLTTNSLYERLKEDGVTRANLYHFLRGERNMPIADLEAIFRALSLEICVEE